MKTLGFIFVLFAGVSMKSLTFEQVVTVLSTLGMGFVLMALGSDIFSKD